MGLADSIWKWAVGSVAGKIAEDGGPLRGLGEGLAKKCESESGTPGFVRDRLRAERIGREIGRVIKSPRRQGHD